MHVLRHAPEVSAFIETHPDLGASTLVRQRRDELLSDEDTSMEELVFFVIPEAGDTVAHLESALGTALQAATGHALWEVIEAHSNVYEMVFVLSSSGYGALVFVSEHDAHPELLALCRTHAVPAQMGSMP